MDRPPRSTCIQGVCELYNMICLREFESHTSMIYSSGSWPFQFDFQKAPLLSPKRHTFHFRFSTFSSSIHPSPIKCDITFKPKFIMFMKGKITRKQLYWFFFNRHWFLFLFFVYPSGVQVKIDIACCINCI